MSSSSRFAGGATVLGLLYVAAACNSVLGIETAELDAPTAVCNAGRGLTLGECSSGASNDCEACINDECSLQQRTRCLENSECRKALANYRTCQSDDCRDASGSCRGCLEGGAGAECFGRCATRCQGSEIEDLCEIFCSCMDTNCMGKLDSVACRMSCSNSNQPWRTNCLLTHCELATTPSSDHCLHASDELRVCPDTAPQADPTCPPPKKLVGYGCDSKAECCSGLCPSKHCTLL